MGDVYLNQFVHRITVHHEVVKEVAVGEVESGRLLPRFGAEEELSVYLNSCLNVHMQLRAYMRFTF